MKKLFVFAFAVVLVFMFTLPAMAVENKFTGYWRTRFYSYYDYDGVDEGGKEDNQKVDTRHRLYYKGILHEDLEINFNLEANATWGDDNSYGAIGGKGDTTKSKDSAPLMKESYAKFNALGLEWSIGMQGFQYGRSGFLFDDTGSGMKIIYRGMDNMIPAFYWIRAGEGLKNGSTNGEDFDYYVALINWKIGKGMQLVPYIHYQTQNDGTSAPDGVAGEAQNVYFLGADFNMKTDMFDLMLTGIYQGGDANKTQTYKAYLADLYAEFKLGNIGIYGEAMYATGDDNTADNDLETFTPPPGASYTWSEGYAKGSLLAGNFGGDKIITDMMNFGLGVKGPIGKALKYDIKFWNMNYAEDYVSGSRSAKDVGNEISARLTWKIIKNLELDSAVSYMIPGDAYKLKNGTIDSNDANPIELATQIVLKY